MCIYIYIYIYVYKAYTILSSFLLGGTTCLTLLV